VWVGGIICVLSLGLKDALGFGEFIDEEAAFGSVLDESEERKGRVVLMGARAFPKNL